MANLKESEISTRTGIKMSNKIFLFSALFMLLMGCEQEGAQEEQVNLENLNDSISYFIAYQNAQQIKQNSQIDIDNESFIAGIRDGLDEGKEPLVPQEEAMNLQQRYMQSMEQENQGQADVNLQEAEAFLEENRQKEGIQVLEEGLQYKVLEEGSGPSPDANDTVSVIYKGQLKNGEVFDDSQGNPVQFVPSQLIPGFTKALTQMKEGSKWRIFIHPDLGYGTRAPQNIGPNQVLIFDMELTDIESVD